MNLFSLFERQVLNRPNQLALVFEERSLSYAALHREIDKCVFALSACGITPRRRVVLLTHNSDYMVAVLLACFKMGVVPCVVNWRLCTGELSTLLLQEHSDLLIYDQHTALALHPLLEKGGAISRSIPINSLFENQGGPFSSFSAAPEDIALQLYTTGTTGRPKGVLHTHDGLLHYTLSFAYEAAWTSDEIYQTSYPLFHISGFSSLVCLFTGGTLLLQDGFQLKTFLETASHYRATRLSLQPVLIKRILESGLLERWDLSSVKKVIYGGAPMPPYIIDQAIGRLSCAFEEIYGTTEICTCCILPWQWHHASPGDPEGRRRYSAGLPCAGMQVRIISENGACCAPGAQGEVTVKTPAMMRGYSTGEQSELVIRDGWYHTGDIGYLDGDGFLYLLGRKSELIISGGENISPREIEDCIYTIGPQISAAAVIGADDSVWGEVPVAFVVPAPGSSLTADDIRSHCQVRLASYKLPKSILIESSLPMSESGKVIKSQLKTRYLSL